MLRGTSPVTILIFSVVVLVLTIILGLFLMGKVIRGAKAVGKEMESELP